MEKRNDDYSCLDLALYLNNCQAHYYYYSDQYEKLYPQEKHRWWLDKSEIIVGGQKIHLITYLGSCYKLQHDKDSLYHVWGKKGFKNAAGLIWLLEALGASEDIIKMAYKAGEEVALKGSKQPAQCSAIKDVIPWDVIKELCERKNIGRPMS